MSDKCTMARLEPRDLDLNKPSYDPGWKCSAHFVLPYEPGAVIRLHPSAQLPQHNVRLHEALKPEGEFHEDMLHPSFSSLYMDIHQGDLVHMQLSANPSPTVD